MRETDLNSNSSIYPNVIPLLKNKVDFTFEEKNLFKERSFNGAVSGAMWDKLQKLKSIYPDTFDWSMYDKLHERFGDKQPRGGVTFKTALKLINHNSSCTKCHYALELDTYGRGCVHNCTYCYAKDQLTMYGYWNQPMPFPMDLAEIRKIFYVVFETDKPSKWRDVLGRRVPIRIGCMSDSFMMIDMKYKVTLEMLKILKFYEYPYIIATRSDLAAHDDYINAMDPSLASVQYSITGTNEEIVRILEPGAPSLKRRFAALKKLAEAGFWTTARLNPLFPTYPDGYFTDKKSVEERFGETKAVPRFDLFNIDQLDNFITNLKECKVPTLMPGFVRLSPIAIKSISKSCGIDFASFYKPEQLKKNGDKKYSDSEIAYYYKIIQDKCVKSGIRFTTCYIGNGEKDYYQYQDLWDNKKDCCDAIGNVKAFKTTSQSISWEIRKKHAVCKEDAEKSHNQSKENEIIFKDVLEKYHPEKLLESESIFTPGLHIQELPPLTGEQILRASTDLE
jgi:DNA repair photolyase